MIKQQGVTHEWRDLTDEEIYANNKDSSRAKRDANGALNREALPSWTKTRVCNRCGFFAPDFLSPDLPSCDVLMIQIIHDS